MAEDSQVEAFQRVLAQDGKRADSRKTGHVLEITSEKAEITRGLDHDSKKLPVGLKKA